MEKKIEKTVVRIICAALIFLLIVAISDLVWVLLDLANEPDRLSPYQQAEDRFLSPEAFDAVFLCCFVHVFYSFSRLSLSYDPDLREATAERDSLSKKTKRVVSSPSFWGELAVILLLLFVLPAGFLRIAGVFRIAAYPAVALAFFLSRLAVLTRRTVATDGQTFRLSVLVKSILKRLILFAVIAAFLPVVLGLAYSFLRVLTLFWSVAFFVTLGVLIACLTLFRYFRAIFKRKKLLKRLQKLCEEKQYSLYFERVYRSILFPNDEPEITIKTGKETYVCKLLSTRSKRTPLYIRQDGEAVADHRFKIGRVVLFHHMVSTRYAFEAEGKKFLILVPAPVFVYGTDGGRRSDLYDSARVGDYTIFSSAAFLHALDLDALDETDRKREW